MPILVTGAAGFIGFHVATALLAQNHEVIGIDNLNDYYEVSLKKSRLALLQENENFHFIHKNISDQSLLELAATHDITGIIHLAAQAGVRYSLINPYAYVESNVMGQVVMLECARKAKNLKHFVYASSSSVYGANEKIPFSTQDAVEKPVSLYAATKRSDELMAFTYAHLYQIPITGLRFFTVYGPWGRPDMAAFLFTRAILAGQPITVFNHGHMKRDFTYIDDIVSGILAALDHPPKAENNNPPAKIYNLGNSKAENLMDFIGTIEKTLNLKAQYDFKELQPGDVSETFADIQDSINDLGFVPKTPISEGIPRFINWYRQYYKA